MRLHLYIQIGFHIHHRAAVNALQVDMRGRGRASHGAAECLTQMLRQFFRPGHISAVLADGGKWRVMINFLVGMAQLMLLMLAPGDGDDGRARQPGVLQSRRQIDRADGLRHAKAGLAADAGVGVGHVGGGFLAMRLYALDAQFLHFHQGARRDIGHKEDIADAVAVDHFGEQASASHFGHGGFLFLVVLSAPA